MLHLRDEQSTRFRRRRRRRRHLLPRVGGPHRRPDGKVPILQPRRCSGQERF